MAAGRIPATALSLREIVVSDCANYIFQFMHRKNILSLYRKILKTINQIPNDGDKQYLKNWARQEFKQNKNATNQDTIRMMLTHGNLQLRELEKMLQFAK